MSPLIIEKSFSCQLLVRGPSLFAEGGLKIMGGGQGERNKPPSDEEGGGGDNNQPVSSYQKQNYITIN